MGITPQQLLGVGLLACMTAAVFGAAPLASWVDASPAGGTVVQRAADEWLALMQHAGFERPYDVLRHAVHSAEAAH